MKYVRVSPGEAGEPVVGREKVLVNGRFRKLRWFEVQFPHGLIVDLRKPIPESYFPDSAVEVEASYRPPLKFSKMRRSVMQRLGWLSGLTWAALAFGAGMLFAFASGAALSFVVHGFTVTLFEVGVVAIIGSMILSSANKKYVRSFRGLKADYALQQIESHNVAAFTNWVESSYGVKAEEAQSEYRLRELASYPSSFDSIKFGDRKFKTVVKKGRLSLIEKIEEIDQSGAVEGMAKLPAATVSKNTHYNDSLFTGESFSVWLSVNNKLEILKEQKLVVEDRHVVSRVSKDVQDVVVGMRQLSALKITEVPADVLLVLQGLENELQQVLDRQVDVVLKGFSQQAAYVDARKEKDDSGSDSKHIL